MVIKWDCDQLVFLANELEKALPIQGTMHVITSKVPPNSFSGKIVPTAKEFRLYLSLDDCLAQSSINVALGYTLLYAYSREGWSQSVSIEEVEAAHKEVCLLLESINKEFSSSVRLLLDILQQWHKAETDHGSELKDDEFMAVCDADSINSPLSFNTKVKYYGAN